MANNQEEQLSGISQNDLSFSQSSGLFLPLPRDQQTDEQQLNESNSVVFSDESRYELSGFSSNCSEATDPLDSVFYRVMPSKNNTIVRFYTKPLFHNIVSVLEKEFKISENSSTKFSVKTHVDGKKCTIHVDRTDLTLSLTGHGHVYWRDNNFRKLTINMFNNFVNKTNSALYISHGAQSVGTSVSFSKKDGTISNSQGETAPDHDNRAQAHDSPIMRNISSLMDMIHTLQGQVSALTEQVNTLVQQAAESVYQTVDETQIAPSVEEVFSDAGNEEAIRTDTSKTASLQGSPTSPTVINVTPTSGRQTVSRLEIQTSTPRPGKPQPPTRKQSHIAQRQQPVQRMTPTPMPRQSLRPQPRQTLLIGDSIVSGINPKGLKSNVHKHGIAGGTIDSILRDIKVFDLQQFSNILVYIGGNDTANGTDMEYFEEKFDQLLSHIKQKNSSCKVIIVNCCPRGDVDTTAVNHIIYRLSEYHHMDLIDADHAFHNKYSEVI